MIILLILKSLKLREIEANFKNYFFILYQLISLPLLKFEQTCRVCLIYAIARLDHAKLLPTTHS